MASKATPKKLYKKRTESTAISRCRLCNCVTDPGHSRNLFGEKNKTLLRNAEVVYGNELRQDNNLPHLVCASCVRRLNNFIQFKNTVTETQRLLQEDTRAKRCVEISPSVAKPSAKVRATGVSRRRSIDFNTASGLASGDQLPENETSSTLALNTAQVLHMANKELLEVARRTEASVLRQRNFDGMSADSWMSEVLEELATRCPVTSNILSALLESTVYQNKKQPAICLIYGIMMFLRCHELSRIQRINSVLLIEGQASVNSLARLNKYGLCLEPKMKYQILEDIGKQFIDHAAELVKSGHTFVFVLDNIDWEEKVHDMRENVQNRSVHAVATSVVFDRVYGQGLPDSGPQKYLKDCNVHQLVDINRLESDAIRNRYRILVAKLLFQHFPSFAMFKEFVPESTDCKYAEEMRRKSTVVTMPVLMKDEKKYAEVVDVLDQLEKWTQDIYSAAGLCSSNPEPDHGIAPAIATTSRPDQPAAHIPPTSSDSDPLCGVKIPCYGDQLTRVRFAGAKDLRAGCHLAKQRLDHLYPFCIVDWHTKRSFLKTIFKKLYKNSGREKGTLRFFREKLNRRNVTVDVKHYEDCVQLFYSVGKCYVIEALLEFFQMADAEHRPTANGPHSVYVLTEEYRKTYIVDVLDKFLNEFVFNDGAERLSEENGSDEEISLISDGVWCYGINLIKSFLLLADFKDAVSTGNGEHLLILRKQLLVHFFSTPGFNEFAIEMLINILQCEVLLSEAEAHRCKWAATVNWKGGSGKNVEIDLFQENRNCEMKNLIRSMGANKTEKAIGRASKASGGVSKIVEAYDEQVNIRKQFSSHSHKSSSNDEKSICSDLRNLRPFQKEDGRNLQSFVGISPNPTSSFDQTKFATWINRHKKNILMHYTVAGETDDEDSESSE